MIWFTEVKKLNKEIAIMYKEKRALKEELEDLKLKKRMEAEEIKHLMKLDKERSESSLEKRKIELEKQYAEKISAFREEQRAELTQSLTKFHGKMEAQFKSELDGFKEVLGIMQKAMPNVNYNIERKIKE